MILIIDHFDSFSHNLYQLLAQDFKNVFVKRCDKITISEIEKISPECIILSPGPGGPNDTGVTLPLLESAYAQKTPIIGVCLGFQAMMHHIGAKVELAPEVVHGKIVTLPKPNHPIFNGQNESMQLARYHSLAVCKKSLPTTVDCLLSHQNMVMVAELKEYPWLGIQFHPESFLTSGGRLLMRKSIDYLKERVVATHRIICDRKMMVFNKLS